MTNVLADLCVESEAATLSAMRLARAYDEASEPSARSSGSRRRSSKYWVCKRTPPHAAEAMEVLGGNGYVEESGMPRLYREAPLNSIWEGSGNVMCLDVLRALPKEPEAAPALFAELDESRGRAIRGSTRTSTKLRAELADSTTSSRGRGASSSAMALALQGSLRRALRAGAGRRRVLRLAVGRRRRPRLRHAARRVWTSRAIVERHRPVL